MTVSVKFKPGDLVKARGREWVVLPETGPDLLKLRPLGGSEDDSTLIYLPLEPKAPESATFSLPNPERPGSRMAALILRDALRLKLRSGAGPFRSFGNLAFEPRAYQLVPLLMALKLNTIRLLVADDVGIGKTIEAGLVAREMLDRGEIERTTVICPPHLCDQWQDELSSKFHIDAEIVRTGTAARLERGLRPGESVFEVYPHTVVSLDYIKADRRRDDFLRACPEFVIVDEAHTCVQSSNAVRHQRYQLLKGLAETEPRRHMVFLTATPHSGDDTAFHNLLGLIQQQFTSLREMDEGKERESLRTRLSNHFVQRRRGDIAEWRDSAGFPVRESREATYALSGDWGALVEDVIDYARGMVRRTEKGSRLEQRMSWWAAIALLRCVSSSPAAASMALRTRLRAAEGQSEDEQLAILDQSAGESVLDGLVEEGLSQNESVPAGTIETLEDASILRRLIERAEKLRGILMDPKASLLAKEIKRLVEEGFRPVVFCRYIATANYLEEVLRNYLSSDQVSVISITGEIPPEGREERVRNLEELEEGVTPVLVATDCLSEGINLQRQFDAAVHYDLTWNPTRHEQREGRVDRFGQGSKVVRTLMIYGSNNPVDGAVLKVILRKAEKIRKELGVAVPLPVDNTKVVEAVMQAVLLHGSKKIGQMPQMTLGFEEIENQVDAAWQEEKNRVSRTVFAQRRLSPEEVLPEWSKAVSFMGGEEDVFRFVKEISSRLGASLERKDGYFRLPVRHFPRSIQERLESIGLGSSLKLAFSHPAPTGAAFVPRSHPLVASLADFVTEQALEEDNPDLGARCTAFFTSQVAVKTTVFLLRLRSQLLIEKRRRGGSFTPERTLLSEECLGIAIEGSGAPNVISDETALTLLSSEAERSMQDGQKTMLIKQALELLENLPSELESLAYRRTEELLADHRRIRDASEIIGERYFVTPALPVDIVGVYVLMPVASR